MDYEQKYKKLVDAIKVMRDINPSDEGLQNWINDNVPELAESEDERIRKAILSGLKYLETELGWDAVGDVDISDAYAWLEKQGESDETKAKIFLINKGYPIDANGVFPTYEEMYNIIREGLEKQENQPQGKTALEAINEEKVDNANKVEPKFNEGDWVVTDKDTTVQIGAVNNGYYTINNGMDFSISYVDKHWRLWTIKDAKDGDILVADLSDSIILFKGIEDNNIDFYCDYDFSEIDSEVDVTKDRFAINNGGEHYGSVEDAEDIHPATKEQRDTLMQAMTNAGYEWDEVN